jgi:hypothetical protein
MLVDSKQQKLGMQEIIDIALAETKSNPDLDPKQTSVVIAKELTLPSAIVVQKGNTLFIIHKSKEPTQGIFRALNADTPRNYLENSREFIMEAREKMELDVLITQFKDPTLINIFKAIGRSKPAGMGYQLQQSKDGKTYQVIVTLNSGRG